MQRRLLTTLLFVAVVWLPATATTFTVSNTNNSGTGSLRQAIIDANTDNSATAGSPHIIDATGISGTISLESALPAIGNHIMIDGPEGASLTITRGVATEFRIVLVDVGYTVAIHSVTITNGSTGSGDDVGGGIYNRGSLTVTNSTFTDNSSYRGAGIYNEATLTVVNSTFTGNTGCNGGGIFNTGTAFITNSTLAGNDASTFCSMGSGVVWGGGGIANDGGSVTILNTILAGNTLDGEAPFSNGSDYIFYDYAGDFDSRGHNLIGYVNSHPAYSWWVVASDLQNVDPLLEALASNGGGTQTMALSSNSPAIDAGSDDVLEDPYNLTTDQRGTGFDRSVGSHVDIGAYEYASTDVTPPTLSVSLSPTSLWPPNGSMQTISITTSVSDNSGSATWVLNSISGDDGATSDDWNYTANSSPGSVQLRAERTGSGDGRTYTLNFTASDGNDNTTDATAYVHVPHSQNKVVTSRSRDGIERGFMSEVAPNPFSASTHIRFTLPEDGAVSVRVYDQLGNEVAVLQDDLKGGIHSVVWNGMTSGGKRAASGEYFYRIESSGMSETGLVVLRR